MQDRLESALNELPQRLLDRFLRYVKVDTQSDRHIATHPSTPGQWDLLKMLENELKSLGLSDVTLDEHGYLIARIPSNLPDGRLAPTFGLMAHVDTSSDMSGKDVKPQVITEYQGGDIRLGSSPYVLSAEENPLLADYIGQTVITTDGTTLLGADDKAGVAEIMSIVEILLADPGIEHGEIEVIFTPDEETGKGMDLFPVERLRSRCCYTMDGNEHGVIDAECFNASLVEVVCTGIMYHPGSARGRLVNALTMMNRFLALIPQSESPEATDGRYGFYYPLEISGTAASCRLSVYLRDFERTEVQRRYEALVHAAQAVEHLFPGGRVKLTYTKQYANMRDHFDSDPLVMGNLRLAAERAGITLRQEIIRGGTDGARLGEMGIPTPNIFTGGQNYHSRFEWAALPAMADACRLLIELVRAWGKVGA